MISKLYVGHFNEVVYLLTPMVLSLTTWELIWRELTTRELILWEVDLVGVDLVGVDFVGVDLVDMNHLVAVRS